MTVSYVELSRDAAIAGEDKDLKFVNSLENPVTIRAITKDGWLIFRIEGKETRDPNRTIHFETVILSKQEPGEDVITVDKTMVQVYHDRKILLPAAILFHQFSWQHFQY